MPFRSAKQRRYMWANHPDIARRWTEEYGSEPQPKRKAGRARPKKRAAGRRRRAS